MSSAMANESTIELPKHIRSNEVVGAGLSGWVHRLDAVVKSYPSDGTSERITEVAVYKRLGADRTWHKGILQFYGMLDGMSIVLQFAQHGSIRDYLNANLRRSSVPLSTKLRWAEQVASAVSFLHSKSIFHCDISCNNVFLDKHLNAMVGDFAGSSIDGEEHCSWYEISHCHPDVAIPSIQTEIFALGSTLYEIMCHDKPFGGLPEDQVEDAFRRGQFPSMRSLPALKTTIDKCWRQRYESVDEVLQDIQKEGKNLQSHPAIPGRLTNQLAAASISVPRAHQSRTTPWLCCSVAVLLPLIWWMRPGKSLFKCWHELRCTR